MISRQDGQTNIGIVILLFILAIAIPLITFLGFRVEFSVVAILAFIIFLIAFIKTDFALVILIFSMLLSPELEAGGAGGRAVTIRADDIFLAVIFLGWMAKMALNKELGFYRVTPLNRPIQVYILVALITTFWGAVKGYINIKYGFFYILKYFEYYLLFFMVTNNLKNRRQMKIFLYSIIIVSFIICIYAWHQHLSGVERVSAPFEGKAGEANTLGGYLVLIMMISAALFLNIKSMRERMPLFFLLVLSFPALLFTLSRGSWLSFFVGTAVLFILTRHGKKQLLIAGVIVLLLAPIILPRAVQERALSTFTGQRQFSVLNRRVTLDDSASARIDSWRFGLKLWSKEPILGFGVSSAGPTVDNQYVRVLIETGAIGFFAFMWVLVTLLKQSLGIVKQFSRDRFASAVAVGFIAGFAGLLVHSFTAATFIIIRIMEPFWFLAAIVIMLPEITPEYKGAEYEE
jgi:O-antigen ligase